MRRDVFQAIADPVRRDIIELLSEERLTVKEIADHFEISRPAISKHLKILRECGILELERKGREHYCRIDSAGLIPAFVWIDHHRKLWEDRIDAFEDYVNRLKKERE